MKKALKILDIMILSNDNTKTPLKWLFTDTKGFFCSQDISSMNIDDLIKAVVSNIEGNPTPLVHAEILVFL